MNKSTLVKGRRFMSFLLSSVIALSCFASTTAFADEDENACIESVIEKEPALHFSEEDGYVLISEETTVDENGIYITHRSYIKNSAVPCDDLERYELPVYESVVFTMGNQGQFEWVEIWAEGTFAYYPDANTCFVKNAQSGYNILHKSAKFVSEKKSHDNNQGGFLLWGKKYAYIEHEVTLDHGGYGGKNTFTLTVKVNSVGKKDVKEKYS